MLTADRYKWIDFFFNIIIVYPADDILTLVLFPEILCIRWLWLTATNDTSLYPGMCEVYMSLEGLLCQLNYLGSLSFACWASAAYHRHDISIAVSRFDACIYQHKIPHWHLKIMPLLCTLVAVCNIMSTTNTYNSRSRTYMYCELAYHCACMYHITYRRWGISRKHI